MWGLCHCGSNSLALAPREGPRSRGRTGRRSPPDRSKGAGSGVYPYYFQRQPAVRNWNNKTYRHLTFTTVSEITNLHKTSCKETAGRQ